MRTFQSALPKVLAIATLTLVGACASKSDVEALRADVAQAQADAAEAKQRAAAAEAAALAAQERADRIYRESLRK
ncbi:hypothetical protein M1105_09435 [Limibaculum sp. FT325]|uniref:hypothetical protein n=1 Tax=Thermohalobaculum sediminis TaxID=2939436 RepID=UPI0020BD9B78|nr:hypothetical protein [Limibaculum sediminis]MCL5777208.1 hypothetical protein [Limibaculum sediminis]